MSSTAPWSFRRRIGRAASPPTWACYEQIPYGDEDDDDCSDSTSESWSEDEDDYQHAHTSANGQQSDSEDGGRPDEGLDNGMGMDVDMDVDDIDASEKKKKDLKGKQKAVDPEPEPEVKSRHQRKKPRRSVYTLRPILTIQKSQGFVWNQDLFVPPYIKDRYIASTSPPNSRGFISSSASSTNSVLNPYEVEVVEIRVNKGDLDGIIP